MPEKLAIATFLSPNYEPLYRDIAEAVRRELNVAALDFVVGDSFAQFVESEYDLVWACGFWYTQHPHAYEPLVAPVLNAARYDNLPVYFVDLLTKNAPNLRMWLGRLTADELAGKVFGYNEAHSFSGYQVFATELERANLGWDNLAGVVQTGSHLNSLQALRSGQLDLASLDSSVLDYALSQSPDLAEQLYRLQSFGPYPAPPLLINRRLEPAVADRITATLLNLPAAQLAAFGIRQYQEVSTYFYEPMKDFLP